MVSTDLVDQGCASCSVRAKSGSQRGILWLTERLGGTQTVCQIYQLHIGKTNHKKGPSALHLKTLA